MKIRDVVMAASAGMLVVSAAVVPSLALAGHPYEQMTSTVDCVPDSGDCVPSPSPVTSQPGVVPSCDVACEMACGADVACEIRWTIVIGGSCTSIGQNTVTQRGEKCTCRDGKGGPKWVKVAATDAATLPVTGSSAQMVALGGVLLVLVGSLVIGMISRRRRNIKFDV